MVVFDNTFLTLALHPSANPPLDPSTNLPVGQLEERIELLLDSLEEEHETIIIPTPVLTEFLILAGKDGPKYLALLDNKRTFRIEPFDTKAAIELAAIELDIRASRSARAVKRDNAQGTWAKIKFDRQIVTIGKVHGAHTIFSDDEDVEKFANRCGLSIVKTWELPVPPSTQRSLLTEIERLESQVLEPESEHAQPTNETNSNTSNTTQEINPSKGESTEEETHTDGDVLNRAEE